LPYFKLRPIALPPSIHIPLAVSFWHILNHHRLLSRFSSPCTPPSYTHTHTHTHAHTHTTRAAEAYFLETHAP
jgi:hypothetical protein